MYATKPLSLYKESSSSLSLPPLEGPNSGYLVIQNEESVETSCFGLCKDTKIREFPFPQNRMLTVKFTEHHGESSRVRCFQVYFIPVLNQPLSSNKYYVIKARGKHKGEAYTSSTEENMVNCCFCTCLKDVKTRALDPHDPYQQFEITHLQHCCSNGFIANSVAPDGFPPYFLRRRQGWDIKTSTLLQPPLGDANGLNKSLRAQLPKFDVPLTSKNSELMVIGKWYCPFMFVKEEDKFEKSVFYEMTLEQQWEKIYECENNLSKSNVVILDVNVQTEVALLFGKEAVNGDPDVVNGVMWFRSLTNTKGKGSSLGLSLSIIERMKWEQERVGWLGGQQKQGRIQRVEEFGEKIGWKKYACYILVERFALKRMDGSLLLTYEYRHAHQIHSKWE
ncbi:uncharacterized protein LOC122074716 [Macadamia integrifolia]|uniref:uncharacterized protein LOC122074716 n=1 Tax=Macadamia integrifolia TaxID=60698 RepID=UPI001C4EB9A3|nr:uncharacterized protein LOC122074716 [Macadamia integrifolia]